MSNCGKSKCHAELEWFCLHAGVVRVFGGGETYGDPYCFIVPFRVLEQYEDPLPSGKLGIVELVGLVGKIHPCQWRALHGALIQQGWGVVITRIKNGEKRRIELHKKRWG